MEKETLRLILYATKSTPYQNVKDEVHSVDLRRHPLKNIMTQVFMPRCIQTNRTTGIMSSSFQSDMKHNLFLEWDRKDLAIDQLYYSACSLAGQDGFLVETGKGYHVICEASLSIAELVDVQKKFGCCTGFTGQTEKRGFATLRVGPKAGSYLHILEDSDPCLLRSAYRELLSLEEAGLPKLSMEEELKKVLDELACR